MSTNQISTFTFPQTLDDIRVVALNDQPWFVAADVCKVLGFSVRADGSVNVTYALRPLEASEARRIPRRTLYPTQGGIAIPVINKHGLWRLLSRSDKPVARLFQDWLFYDVLPAIEKDGAYVLGEEKVATGQLSEDELILRAMTALQNKVARLTEVNQKQAGLIDAKIRWIDVQTYQGLRGEYLSKGNASALGKRAAKLTAQRGMGTQ